MVLEPATPKEIVAERSEVVVVHQHCPDRPYLELEIPVDFGEAHYVEFTVESRDQGWTSEKVGNSWSWFNASIRRPHGRNNIRPLHLFDNHLAKPEFSEHSRRIIPNHPWGVHWKPWIKSLRPGDVIELVPRAIYVCWLNVVRQAKIRLRYTPAKAGQTGEAEPDLPSHANGDLYIRRLDAGSREIRVLSLQPGSFEDPIECHITYVKLSLPRGERQNFDALSYSWGDDRERVEVSVQQNGGESKGASTRVNITRPAHTALKHLRHKSIVLNLWIDIVCINQDNLDERAQQVAMMASIFAEARTVHVWLGTHPGIESALLVIRDIHNWIHRTCAGGSTCQCRGSPHTALNTIQLYVDQERKGYKYGQRDWDADKHEAIFTVFDLHYKSFTHEPREYAGGTIAPHVSKLMSHVFESAWFRRVWVIQEVLKAQDVMVHSGKESIDWTEFAVVSDWLGDQHFTNAQPDVQSGEVSIPLIWQNLNPSAKRVLNGTISFSLVSPVTQSSSGILDIYLASLDMKSKEARDKLFAILSFGRETSQNMTLPILIQPDYNKQTDLVFADFTRWWIVEHRSLSVLSYVHSDRTRTWVRVLCDVTPLQPVSRPSWGVPMDGKYTWAQATLEAQFNFRATGQTMPDLNLLGDHNTSEADRRSLRLLGHTVSTIQKIGTPVVEKRFAPKDKHQRQLMDAFREIIDPASVHERWKTRQVTDPKVNAENLQAKLQDHLQSHHSEDAARDLFTINPFSSKNKGSEMLQVGSCADPCCFTASNGLRGICPWRAKKGDVIVLLLGGNVPFLLRPCQATQTGEVDYGSTEEKLFELVGECFTLGIMNGELMQEFQEKGVSPELFTLN